MTRFLLVLAALLALAFPAQADQIDYLMTFATEAAAQSDPVVGAYWHSDSQGGGSWDMSQVLPDVEVYTISGANKVNNPGWFIIVSLPRYDASFQNDGSACVLVADRDVKQAGIWNPSFLRYIASSVTALQLQSSIHIEPTYEGSNYGFGVSAVAVP